LSEKTEPNPTKYYLAEMYKHNLVLGWKLKHF